MTGLLNIVADPATFATVLRVMTPLLIAALGILISDRAGVFNLGMEGMMLTGALVGVLVSAWTGSAWLGLLAFTLPAQPAWQPPAFCQPADAAQLPAPAFERKWAPTSFDGYQTYACQPPEAGPGLAHALAIAPDGRSVLVWSSSR